MPFIDELSSATVGPRSAVAAIRAFVKDRMLPPLLVDWMRRARTAFGRRPWLEYAPEGWNTALPRGEDAGWNSASAVETERAKWAAFRDAAEGTGPLAFAHDHTDQSTLRVSFHNINMTYAYVLTRAAAGRASVSVLDWGGSLGHGYLLGRAVLPGVRIEFHCKEVTRLAEIGRQLNPDVQWYDDETCLDRTYDLVMLNGVLQYVRDWRGVIERVSTAAGSYLFFGLLPLVERGPGFVALQRYYGGMMLHQQFNRHDLLEAVEGTGQRLVREFVTGYRPAIKNAPEPCELRSWLFKRESR